MLLLKSGAKFYALTWKDLQDILFMGKKKVAECWRALDFICVSKYTHIHRHTDMCTNRCAYTQTHTHTHTHTSHYAHFKDEETEGLPRWFSGEEPSLLMQGARVQSLVGELDPVW